MRVSAGANALVGACFVEYNLYLKTSSNGCIDIKELLNLSLHMYGFFLNQTVLSGF